MTPTKEEIIEGNFLLAKYLGAELDTHFSSINEIYQFPESAGEVLGLTRFTTSPLCTIYSQALYFHEDWNHLMVVLERIEYEYYKGFPINVTLTKSGCKITINSSNASGKEYIGNKVIADTMNINYEVFDESEMTSKILFTWIACVIFVRWYNQNIQPC